MPSHQIYRGAVLSFKDDPATAGDDAIVFFEDGALLLEDGLIAACGEANEVLDQAPQNTPVRYYQEHLIIPGLIDTHIHFPQVEVIASFGEQLLDWLNQYTFPTEQKFADVEYASKIANFFLDELLRNGTTTALVFGSVHASAAEAFFKASHRRNTRMICGKVMMDREAPAALCDTAESAYADSRQLIEDWHGKGRQLYAITPRFAITSTPEQLAAAGKLKTEFPDVYVQTHISENRSEVDFVGALFSDAKDYLDVYDQYGLLDKKTVLAHGIHLTERERKRLQETGSSVAFCPTSNLFLGSGLLDLKQLEADGVCVSVATDVGGGTSFSMLRTLHEAYKVLQLQGQSLCPMRSLYMATLGNARSLHLADKIGSLEAGKEADFTILDFNCTPLMALKQQHCKTLREKLFAMIMLADDRAVAATVVAGQCLHERDKHATNQAGSPT